MSAPVYAPYIVIPPLTSCERAYLLFGQGTPPFTIFPIASGDGNGTSLEDIPSRPKAGLFEWKVDFQPGANITFALVDATGQTAFSVPRVVQIGATTICARNVYARPKSNLGAILGGVLGSLAVIALLLFLLFLRRHLKRKQKRNRLDARSHSPSPSETAEMAGSSGLVRAGTFNLRQRGVEFNEPSMDHLAMMTPPPPTYGDAAAIPGGGPVVPGAGVGVAETRQAAVNEDETDNEDDEERRKSIETGSGHAGVGTDGAIGTGSTSHPISPER